MACWIHGLLGELDKLQLRDVDGRDVALVRRHPGRHRSPVAVQPARPVEGDIAASADLGDVVGYGVPPAVAGDIHVCRVQNGIHTAASVGDTLRRRAERAVDVDVPARVAGYG